MFRVVESQVQGCQTCLNLLKQVFCKKKKKKEIGKKEKE